MKNKVLMILALLLSFSGTAFAETIEGRIADTSSSRIQVTVYDQHGNPYPNALFLQADQKTTLNGVSSLLSLRRGDGVRVEVRQVSERVWRADSITKLSSAQASKPAPVKPSPSMRDVLGNPVVRGAATGAMTGAIASAASGGKAGKGALVGAGVGAAGGLLMEMFNRPQQAQETEPLYTSSEEAKS